MEKVVCDHPGCHYECSPRGLASHVRSKHPTPLPEDYSSEDADLRVRKRTRVIGPLRARAAEDMGVRELLGVIWRRVDWGRNNVCSLAASFFLFWAATHFSA